MLVRHRARRDWFVWWGQPARTVELLGSSLDDCRGHRLGFVPRMLRLAFAVFLVSSVAPLGRRAFRLANALRLLLLSRRTWKLPREHVL